VPTWSVDGVFYRISVRIKLIALCAAFLLGPCLGLAVPGSAQAGVNVGRHIDETAKKNADTKLSQNAEYQKATAERKKQIREETIREMTRIEMEKVLVPMQLKVEKRLESALVVALGQALPADDKRVPEIKNKFIPTLRKYVNENEDISPFYGLYEATNGDNHGTSLETIMSGILGADRSMTEADIEIILRRIGTQVTPNLNSTEIIRLRNYFFSGILSIR